MWDCMVKGWEWLGGNAGQVQTIFAILAFWIAYRGYIKLLKYREVDARLVFINLLNDSFRENIKFYQYTRRLEILAKDLKEIDSISESDLKLIEGNLKHIVKWKNKLKEIKVELEKIYDQNSNYKVNYLEESAIKINQSLKEFIRASSGFQTIENDLEKIKSKYSRKD